MLARRGAMVPVAEPILLLGAGTGTHALTGLLHTVSPHFHHRGVTEPR